MMEQFTTALYDDLHNLRRTMAETTQQAQHALQETTAQVDHLKEMIKSGIVDFGENAQVC